MHIKDAFAVDDLAAAQAIIGAHPFATLVSDDLRATHMPCLVEEASDQLWC